MMSIIRYSLFAIAVLLTSCKDTTSIQRDFVSNRDTCRAKANSFLGIYIQPYSGYYVNPKDQKSAENQIYCECMKEYEWQAFGCPKPAKPGDTPKPAAVVDAKPAHTPAPAPVIIPPIPAPIVIQQTQQQPAPQVVQQQIIVPQQQPAQINIVAPPPVVNNVPLEVAKPVYIDPREKKDTDNATPKPSEDQQLIKLLGTP